MAQRHSEDTWTTPLIREMEQVKAQYQREGNTKGVAQVERDIADERRGIENAVHGKLRQRGLRK